MTSGKKVQGDIIWQSAIAIGAFILSAIFGVLVYLAFAEYQSCRGTGVPYCKTSLLNIVYFAFTILFFIFGLVFMKEANLLSRLFSKKAAPSGKLAFADDGFTFSPTQGKAIQVKWNNIQKFTVKTNDQGPFTNDLYFIFNGNDGEQKIPNDATGTEELVNRLTRLPNFDNELFVLAMSSSENKDFVCWERK